MIDGNPITLDILVGQLRDLGVGTVLPCEGASDARRQLEQREFDVVLCDQRLDDDQVCGQSLLDDLRRAELLPLSTVFILMASEASPAAVARAAESGLDDFMLRPFKTRSLIDHLEIGRAHV